MTEFFCENLTNINNFDIKILTFLVGLYRMKLIFRTAF